MTIDEILTVAANQSFEVDNAIAALNQQLQVLIGDLQREKRPHAAGVLIGASANLRDSFYRKLGGMLQDMAGVKEQ